MSLLGKRFSPEQREVIERVLETAEPIKVDRDTWYRCPHCEYKTKQRRGLPQVAHNCSVKRALVNLKEDTDGSTQAG